MRQCMFTVNLVGEFLVRAAGEKRAEMDLSSAASRVTCRHTDKIW